MSNHTEILKKAEAMLTKRNKAKGYATISLLDKNGYPTGSPASIENSQGLEWVTFNAGIESNKVARIKNDNRGSISITTEDNTITLVGHFEILTDMESKKAHWNPMWAEFWTGYEDQNHCILRFIPKSYNLWIDYEEACGDL